MLTMVGWLSSPLATFGLGLGSPVTRAVLGDTLSVSVPVRLEAGEDLPQECAKADVFFGDDKLPASGVQTRVLVTRGGPFQAGETSVQVRTLNLINEPVVTVSVSIGCPSRITRRFVTLVEPPVTMAASRASQARSESDSASAAEVRAALHSGDMESVVDPVSRRSRLAPNAPSLKVPSVGVARSSGAAGLTQRGTSASPSLKKPADSAPRLVLDPVAVASQMTPDLRMSGGLSNLPDEGDSPELAQKRQAASAIWLAMNTSPEEQARDRQRLEAVEQQLTRLSLDSVRASEALGEVQSQLRSREGHTSGPVYVLAAAVLGLIVFMLWREYRFREVQAMQQRWLASNLTSELADDSAALAGATDAHASEPSSVPDVSGDVVDGAPLQADVHSARSIDLLLPTGPGALTAAAASLDAGSSSMSPAHLRDLSIDELIDLDQQVEFFMVLGQESSAIDVLESHIQAHGGVSPMPFLKLLEIYRHGGLRADYERTRMNFNLRFNAHAPLWDADPEHGYELADYPGVIERIQALWPQPAKALGVLERSLMRQDAESYTFDLPAYRELLLLYTVLRDLQEHPEGGAANAAVSVSFPAGDDEQEKDVPQPLMATLPMKALPALAPVLSLDLELGDDGQILSGPLAASKH